MSDVHSRKQEALELAERARRETRIAEIVQRVVMYLGVYKCPVTQTVGGKTITFSPNESQNQMIEKIRSALESK